MSEQRQTPTGPPNAAEPGPAASPTAAPTAGPGSETGTEPGKETGTETGGETGAEIGPWTGAASLEGVEGADQFTLTTLTNAISANFRRAVLATVMACAGLGLTYASGGVLDSSNAPIRYFQEHTWLATLTASIGAALFLIFGSIAVRSATKEILKTVPDRMGDNRKNGLRWICLLVGYLFVIFGTLGALNVPIERLLLGGAVTGVILGIAAQQSLGNLFAGLVLLVVRPIAIGQPISLRSGPLGGVLTGEVVDMNLTYVKLSTAKGQILLPNSTILTATIGPPHIFDD